MKRPHNWEEIQSRKDKKHWIDQIAGNRFVYKDEVPVLREKYKEKYGEYPPEPNKEEVYIDYNDTVY